MGAVNLNVFVPVLGMRLSTVIEYVSNPFKLRRNSFHVAHCDDWDSYEAHCK